MPLGVDALALLNALPEPAFVLSVAGQVEHANRAALALFGRDITNLASLCCDPRSFQSFLGRASGTKQPLLGSLRTKPETSLGDFRVYANLLVPASDQDPAQLLARLLSIEDLRFQTLTQKVRELNAEVRQRQHAQAVLVETVEERNLLLRELHHRVKNNVQMLAGMLASAQREATHPEARQILGDASRRLAAVGAVQQMLYGSESLAGVRTEEFVDTITTAILDASGRQARLIVNADSFQLANDLAVPLSLILNELLANALKYGRPPAGEPEIMVSLRLVEGDYLLTVEDNGPGFDLVESRKRASGLGLVRGLVRQLGGKLSVERTSGARVLVRFRDRSLGEMKRAAS